MSRFSDEGITISFPTFPSSGALVKKFGASKITTYDGLKLDDCANFDFGVITTPSDPGKHKRVYAAEHVLEAQVIHSDSLYSLPKIFRDVMIERSNILSDDSDTEMGDADDSDTEMGSDSGRNINALEFPDPRQGKTGILSMCEFMEVWWDKKTNNKKNAWSANSFVATAYPQKSNVKESQRIDNIKNAQVLLPSSINSDVKANWFTGKAPANQANLGLVEGRAKDQKSPNWDDAFKWVKLHLYFYKYLATPEVQKILVKQANRVAKNLEEAETSLIQQHIGGIPGYVDPKKPYRKQHFSDDWRPYVRQRHSVVEQQCLKFMKTWARKLRSWNSQPGTANALGFQQNKDIREMFENLERAVNGLPPWNIDWDEKDSSGKPIM
ncbi:unnamed protein product [Penicillium pancosmium]